MSEQSDDDIVNSSQNFKKTESSANSCYFETDVHVAARKPGSSAQLDLNRGTVTVTVKSGDKKASASSSKTNEVSITSSFRRKPRGDNESRSVHVATQSERPPTEGECRQPETESVASAYFPAIDAASQPGSVQSGSERGPSPATARLLEWDSAGDVGYRRPPGRVLSTVEELALESRLGRSDLEGTPGSSATQPVAESTPKEAHIFPEVLVTRRSPTSSPEPLVRKTSSSPSTVRPRERSDSESVRNGTLDSGPLSADARVNSFEYLPGHVYESVQSGECEWMSESVEPGEELDTAVDQLVRLLGGQKGPKARAVLERLLDRLTSPTSTRASSPPHPASVNSTDQSPQDPTRETRKGRKIESEKASSSQSPSEGHPESFKTIQSEMKCIPHTSIGIQCNGLVSCARSNNENYPNKVGTFANSRSQGTQLSPDLSVPSSSNRSDTGSRSKPTCIDKCIGTRMSTSLSGADSSDVNSPKETSSHKLKQSLRQKIHLLSPGKSRRSNSDYATSESATHSPRKEKLSKRSGTSQSVPCKLDDLASIKEQMDQEKKHHMFWISSEINQLTCLKKMLESHEEMKTCYNRIKIWKAKLAASRAQEYKPGQKLPHPSCLRPQTSSSSSTSDWTSHLYDSDLELPKQRGGGDADCMRQKTKEVKLRFRKGEPKQTPVRLNGQIKGSDVAVQVPPPAFRTTSLKETGPMTAYTIQFPSKSEPKVKGKKHSKGTSTDDSDNVMLSVKELKSAIDEIVAKHKPSTSIQQQPSLKDYLENERPDVVIRAEARRQILSEIAELRKARQQARQKVIAGDTHNLPPPPLVKRVVSQKELRKQTERRYRQLGEVLNKKAEIKRKQDYRTNRLMAQVFNRKLQKKTLQGQVNLSNSVCVIGSS